jgi:hypothetical protein
VLDAAAGEFIDDSGRADVLLLAEASVFGVEVPDIPAA